MDSLACFTVSANGTPRGSGVPSDEATLARLRVVLADRASLARWTISQLGDLLYVCGLEMRDFDAALSTPPNKETADA